jgi:hypothetical protein
MEYTTDAPPVRSLDVAGTQTANAAAYNRRNTNARVRLNPDGLPVAIRRVVALSAPGSFATSRYQVVTPRGVSSVSSERARRMVEHTAPLN